MISLLLRLGATFLVTSSLMTAAAFATDGPLSNDPPRCTEDARLFGDWSSVRPSDTGPRWHRIRFTCDCRYVALDEHAQQRLREQGRFTTLRGTLRLDSPGRGEVAHRSESPFRFERDELYWQGGGSKSPQRYRRTAAQRCDLPITDR
ncbi:MAG: hypothetical protein AAF690_30515 [Acidobacteriota bacterium]